MSINWTSIIDEIHQPSPSLLAVSGGVDSMVLLDLYARRYQFQFVVAHFNHHLRPTSDRDEEIVRNYCQSKDIKLVVGHGDFTTSQNLECAAREKRWEFLEKTAIENGSDVIVTAHHLNDQVENILIRLMRGDPHSALGMQKWYKPESGIIRYKPLLDVPKEELVKAAQKYKLVWGEDETNDDIAYERNWVRKVLLPQMMERRNVIKTIPKGLGK